MGTGSAHEVKLEAITYIPDLCHHACASARAGHSSWHRHHRVPAQGHSVSHCDDITQWNHWCHYEARWDLHHPDHWARNHTRYKGRCRLLHRERIYDPYHTAAIA
jgi:hypothetical protein